MRYRLTLKSISVISLVLSWLTASMAPGLLVHFSVGSRVLISAAQTPVRMDAVALAMIRGELCGFATEMTKAERKETEDPPARTADAVKIVLGLVEIDSIGIVPPRPDRSHPTSRTAEDFLRQAPPGPPPKVG